MHKYIYPSKLLLSITLFLILTTFACNKNDSPHSGECNCTSPVDTLYLSDAYQLIFKEIYTDPEHEDRDNPYFDEQKVAEILNAIQAVYNLDIPERDEVFDEHQIHAFPFMGLHSISLKTDTTAPEVQKLIAGEPTGNQELDNIIAKYKFNEVRTSLYYPEFNWITIISEESLNLFPVINELKAFPFFVYVEFGGGAIGDGNNITLERFENYMKLDFSIGWGDCPSGCIYRKHWIFSVDQKCNAAFLNSFTD